GGGLGMGGGLGGSGSAGAGGLSQPPRIAVALGPRLRPTATRMELWLVDLDAAAPALEALEREVPRLSADERARARRLKEPREQRRRLAAHPAPRLALARDGRVAGWGPPPPPP